MNRPRQPVPTPPRMRNAALLCIFLCTFVGLYSAMEAFTVGDLSRRSPQIRKDAGGLSSMFGDPEMIAAMTEAQLSALEGMSGSRTLILGALTVCCMVAWVSGTRLIRPDGLPREGIRRMLAGSLILAAVLRTVDGAQMAVVVQRAMKAGLPHMSELPGTDPGAAQLARELMPAMAIGMSVALTAAVAGAFLLLGQYFRSESVKQVVALQDEQLER